MSMQNPYAAYQRQGHVMKNMNAAKTLQKEEEAPKKSQPPVRQQQQQSVKQAQPSTNNYLSSVVMSATPEELTLMLYQGAIKFMKQTILQIEAKNVAEANRLNLRAQAIFEELMSSLDMNHEISHQLYNMYQFIIESLTEANIQKDPEIINKMIDLAADLRTTWQEAMKLAKQQKAT